MLLIIKEKQLTLIKSITISLSCRVSMQTLLNIMRLVRQTDDINKTKMTLQLMTKTTHNIQMIKGIILLSLTKM